MSLKRLGGLSLLVIGMLFASGLLLAPKTYATAGASPDLSFEGRVVNSNGTNITDATYNMEFKIYSGGSSSGGGTLVWTEDYLVGGTGAGIATTSGTFVTNLGSVCSFAGGSCETYTNTGVNWATYPLYLSIQVGDTSACTVTTNFNSNCGGDGEMTPYILLTSSPYAQYSNNSGELGGLASTSFGQLASANTFQSTSNVTSVKVLQNSSGSFGADVFDVQGSSGGTNNFIQVTSTAANQGAVLINSLGSNNVTIQSGSGTVSLGSSTTLSNTGASLGVTSGGSLTLSTTGTGAGALLSLTTPGTVTNSATTGGITIQSGSGTTGTSISAGTITIDTGAVTSGGTAAINIGTTNALAVTLGNKTAVASTTAIQGGDTAAGAINLNTANNGTTTAGGITIGNTTGGYIQAIAIGTNSTAASTNNVTIGSTIGGTNLIQASTVKETMTGGGDTVASVTTNNAAAFSVQGTTNTLFTVDTLDNTAGIVKIGSSTTDTVQILLQLDSFSTFADTSTCAAATNQGAMYYNTASNAVRSCINGNWQDTVSTQDLALLLFGVVPNSGTKPGDLIGSSATATPANDLGGPCKVNYDTTKSVYINSCLAFSGGREVTVAAQAVSIAAVAINSYQNICLNASGTPALLGSSSTTLGSQTENNLTTTSGVTYGQPLLCLATILTSGTLGNIAKIYDIRTFTTTTKTYATVALAANAIIGEAVTPAVAASSGLVIVPAATTSQLAGVIVASTGAAGTNGTPNLMIATAGPQWIIASSGTVDDYIIPALGSGVVTGITAAAPTAFDTFGYDLSTYATSCAASTFGNTDCQYSDFTNINIH